MPIPITNEQYENEMRIKNHGLIDLRLTLFRREETIKKLVRLVDELRQPYNNGKYHDLYLKATNTLNDLEDHDEIPHGSTWA